MLRRLRLGRESGPTVLAVLAVAVLVVALVVTGRSLSGRGTRPSAQPPPTAAADAPYRIGDRVTCPLAHPVLATADGHSYPPGHPARPPRDADPVACYETAEDAATAGYTRAPLPAGALELGGVYLLPTSGRFRRQCRQAADRLGLPVPCPTVLPPRPPNSTPPTVCERRSPWCTPQFGFLLEDSGFVVPPGFIGLEPATGAHLAIAAARRAVGSVACVGERPVATVKVRRTRGRLSLCPHAAGATVHLGSVLLRWRERGMVLAVSVQGHSDLNRRLVRALAAHLVLVPPAH
jgi:hypothetical protein